MEGWVESSVLFKTRTQAGVVLFVPNEVHVCSLHKLNRGRSGALLWGIVNQHSGVGVFLFCFVFFVRSLEAKLLTFIFSFHSDIWHDCSSHVKELP